jgi:D-3-phosphoglycerate dehydrogenase
MHIIVPDNLDKVGLDILAATPGVTFDAPAKMTRADLLKGADQADGLIIRSATTVDAEMFAALTKVKAIARAGVGVDNVDLDLATQRGVVVMNAPDGNTIATCELTFGLMLALARHIPQAHASMMAGKWDKKSYMGTELRGKTLGIVGFGRVGQAVAKRALAFEMTVMAHDPYIPDEVATRLGARLVGLDELYAQSDYLTLHSVATKETKGMINAATLAKMKDGVRIINAARGTLINEHDLAAALQSGKVTGAALDVYTEEPPPAGHPLVGLPNVIDLPHLGASTLEAQNEVAIQAVNNLLNALLKHEYRNVVNPAVLEKIKA